MGGEQNRFKIGNQVTTAAQCFSLFRLLGLNL
jgi:hypothetical protein